MRTHDNSGQGNCLYYSYAISWMYHIKSCGEFNSQRAQLCSQLKLNHNDHAKLINILDEPNLYFTRTQKHDIENILGQKLRELAVAQLIKNYQSKPAEDTIRVAIEYHLKKYLAKSNAHYKELFKNDTTPSEDVNPYNSKAIADYLAREGVRDALINNPALLDQHITNCITDNEVMKSYMSKAAQNYAWGEYEALFALHTAVKDKIAPPNNNQFNLEYHRNQIPEIINELQPHIIINNQGNRHWCSIIHPVTDLKILHRFTTQDEKLKKSIQEIISNNEQCHTQLNTYCHNSANVDYAKQKVALQILKIHNQLLSAIAYHLNAGKPLESCVEYKIFPKTLELINNINADNPETLINNYKADLESHTSFWAKNGKTIAKILRTVCAILVGIGGGLLCVSGVGSVAGAAIGVVTAYALSPRFFKTTAEKPASEVAVAVAENKI